MNRCWVWALPMVLLAPLLWAQPPASRSPTERAQQLQRNRELIQTLVASSVLLAEEEDALKRADHCRDVAEQVVTAIRLAARHRDGSRTNELCYHLFDLLERGVAANLRSRRDAGVLPGSSQDQKLREICKRSVDLVKPLEAELRQSQDAELRDILQQALQTVRAGRARVEDALNR